MGQTLQLDRRPASLESDALEARDLNNCVLHEVRQPLSAILMNGQACNHWLDRDTPNVEEAKETVRQIISDVQRVSAIVSSMRALFADQVSMEVYRLPDILHRVGHSMQPLADRAEATLKLDIAPDLPPLTGSPDQLHQLLINLVRNAVEAIEQADVRERRVRVLARRSGNGVEITVSDTGCGIPRDIRARLFQPYFTTRAEGTGLGLAICRRIAQGQGGTLDLARSDDTGTSFRLYLPINEEMIPGDALVH